MATPSTPQYVPAREDGAKSYTVGIAGQVTGLPNTKQVWAANEADARRQVKRTLPLLARVLYVVRTKVQEDAS